MTRSPRLLFASLFVTALSVLLHAVFLWHHPALWRDEVNSVGLATMPTLRELWLSLSFDSSPVLWPLLLRGWIFVAGESDFSLRLCGFLVQLLLIGGLWFSSLATTKRAPLISVLFLGCQPAIVVWPALRSYGLGAALMVWTFGLLWRALETPTPRRVFAALLLAVLSVQCVYANLLLLGAMGVGGAAASLLRGQKRRALLPAAIWLGAAFSLLIYLPTLGRIAPWQQVTVSGINVRYAALVPWLWLAAALILGGAPLLIRAARRGALATRNRDKAAVAASATIDSASIINPASTVDPVLIYATISLMLSFIATILFLQKVGRIPYPWHFVGMVSVVAAGFDALFPAIFRSPGAQKTGAALSMAAFVALLPILVPKVSVRQTNVDVMASYLDQHARPTDLGVLAPFYFGVTYRHYFRGSMRWVAVPDVREFGIQRYDLAKTLMNSPNSLSRVQNLMLRTLRSGHRVWLVGAFPAPLAHQPRYLRPDAYNRKYGRDGWFYARYEAYCTAQIAYFVSQHAARVEVVPVPRGGGINSLEVAELRMVEGLKIDPKPQQTH